MRHLDLNTLEFFRQVAREGSISRAAVKLGRVQSNVSTRIKQFEDQMGSPLFERNQRGMTLTETGQIMLEHAEKLLGLSEQTIDAIGQGKPSGTLRLGAMESTAAARLPKILTRFHNENPNVQVHVATGTAGALIEQLKSNTIDVAFVAEPVGLAGLDERPVFEESLFLIAPKSFPSMEADDLTGKTVIAFEEGCAYRRYLDRWLLDRRIAVSQTVSIGSYLGMFACISAGMGFGVVPKTVIDRLSVSKDFKCLELGGEYGNINTMMTWRKGYQSKKFSAFSELFS